MANLNFEKYRALREAGVNDDVLREASGIDILLTLGSGFTPKK